MAEAEASVTKNEGNSVVSSVKTILKYIALFVVIGLPSLVLALFTLDAALIPGADAFIFAATQVVFLGVFMAYLAWRS